MIVNEISELESLKDVYKIIPKMAEYFSDIAKAHTVSINLITDEYGFINYFEKNNKESIKGNYVDRFCIITKNETIELDTSLRDKNFSLEEIVNRFPTGSSFRFIFEGKPYFLYDNKKYLEELIKAKYLNPNFIERIEKIYEQNSKNEKFIKKYPSLTHFIEKITIPLKYENYVFGFVSMDQIQRKNKKEPFSRGYIKKLEQKINEVGKKFFEKVTEINKHTKMVIQVLENLKASLNSIEHPAYTYQHSLNVTYLYYDFIRNLNKRGLVKLDISDKLGLKIGSQFHDIGKISIPNQILNKPTKLTENEFEIIMQHPIIGHNLLKILELPKNTYKLILYHHEKMDGSGYPYHLKDHQIPKFVRAFTIVDIFEALIGIRPYKRPYKIKEALNIILDLGKNKKLDMELSYEFKEYIERIIAETADTTNKSSKLMLQDNYKKKVVSYLRNKIKEK